MLNLTQAIEHGKRVGVRFYVMNDANCVMGGSVLITLKARKVKRIWASYHGVINAVSAANMAPGPPPPARSGHGCSSCGSSTGAVRCRTL